MATVIDSSGLDAQPEPSSATQPPPDLGALGLVELILKQRDRLDRLIREPAVESHLVPPLLAIALVSFTLYGLAMSMVFSAAAVWPRLTAPAEILYGGGGSPLVFVPFDGNFWRPWLDGSALMLVAAYTLGLIAASGICLPSLYFYGLLAGVRMSMLDVVLHTLKAKATAAMALIGLLPIYAALALGIAILPAPSGMREAIYWLGLILPFLAGLWGTWSLYRGFVGLADALPDSCRNRRMCFLRRLVAAWAACYSAVTPVLIFTLWQRLS